MKNPDKNGMYDCKHSNSRKKHPYPRDIENEPCAECIREHYKLPEETKN